MARFLAPLLLSAPVALAQNLPPGENEVPTAPAPTAAPAVSSPKALSLSLGFLPFEVRGFSASMDEVKFRQEASSYNWALGNTEPLPQPLPAPTSQRTKSDYPDLDKTYASDRNGLQTFPWSVNEIIQRLSFSARYASAVAHFRYAPWIADLPSLSSAYDALAGYASTRTGNTFVEPKPAPASTAQPASLLRLGWLFPHAEAGLSLVWDSAKKTNSGDREWNYSLATGLYGQKEFPLSGVTLELGGAVHYLRANSAALRENRGTNLPEIPSSTTVNGTPQPTPSPDLNPVEIAKREVSQERARLSGYSMEASLEARYELVKSTELWTAVRLSHANLSVHESRSFLSEERRNTKADAKLVSRTELNASLSYDLGLTAWVWEMAGVRVTF